MIYFPVGINEADSFPLHKASLPTRLFTFRLNPDFKNP